MAAPDPRAQLPVRQSSDGAATRASPTAAGCGSNRNGARCAAWRAIARRSSRARCGPGTRSARRPARGILSPDAERIAAGLPAQSPDLRRAAAGSERQAFFQLRPDHRTGSVVRRACAHLQAEEGEPEQTSPQFEPMKRYPGMKMHPSLLAYFGGGKKKGGAK